MSLLLVLTLRASLVLAAALVVCVVCRRRSAAFRHLVLTLGVIAAAAMLPLTGLLPRWTVGVPASWADAWDRRDEPAATQGHVSPWSDALANGTTSEALTIDAVVRPSAPRSTPTSTTPIGIVAMLWLGGAGLGGLRILAGAIGLRRATAASRALADAGWQRSYREAADALGLARPVALLISNTSHDAGTWGLLRPRILVPSGALEWNEERRGAVLRHELAHVQRHDWAVQLLAECVRAVFWFNPLAWLVCRRVRQESERACDDAVLRAGVREDAYASHLLDIARTSRARRLALASAMPIARPSTLEGRIAAMLNAKTDRSTPDSRTRVVATTAMAVVACVIAALQLASAQSGPAALRGAVYDSSGGVLPAVELSLENEQGVKWTTPTDGEGRFEFAPVGPGEYMLEANLVGFRPFRQKVSFTRTKDWSRVLTLQVGSLEEVIRVTARRPQGPVAAPAATSGGRVRVGGNIKAPAKTRHVAPTYPESMRAAGLEGTVPLEVLIGFDGKVVSVRVVSAQVHPEFAKAAADAVRQWEFTPTLLNGVPVEVSMTASVSFGFSD